MLSAKSHVHEGSCPVQESCFASSIVYKVWVFFLFLLYQGNHLHFRNNNIFLWPN